MSTHVITTNRQARRDYEVLETIEAGIALRGNEVKSLRERRANLKDSFARIERAHVILYNLHITPYKYATSESVDPTRPRELLLHKAQIRRLLGKTGQRGMTLIPLKLYFKGGYVKVELALAKGRRQYDKRQEIRRREAERSMRRVLRDKRR